MKFHKIVAILLWLYLCFCPFLLELCLHLTGDWGPMFLKWLTTYYVRCYEIHMDNNYSSGGNNKLSAGPHRAEQSGYAFSIEDRTVVESHRLLAWHTLSSSDLYCVSQDPVLVAERWTYRDG